MPDSAELMQKALIPEKKMFQHEFQQASQSVFQGK